MLCVFIIFTLSPNSSYIKPPLPYPPNSVSSLLLLLNPWEQFLLYTEPSVHDQPTCGYIFMKICSLSLSSCQQLSFVNSSLSGGGTSQPSLFSMLGFCLAWACTGVGHAHTTAVSSYVQFALLCLKNSISLYSYLVLHNLSQHSSAMTPQPWQERVQDGYVNCDENFTVSYTLFHDLLWFPMLISHHGQKKLLWWGAKRYIDVHAYWWAMKSQLDIM